MRDYSGADTMTASTKNAHTEDETMPKKYHSKKVKHKPKVKKPVKITPEKKEFAKKMLKYGGCTHPTCNQPAEYLDRQGGESKWVCKEHVR